MLTEEEKRKIEAEEAYRYEIRKKQPPIKTTSLRDKLTKIFFFGGIAFLVLITIAFLR